MVRTTGLIWACADGQQLCVSYRGVAFCWEIAKCTGLPNPSCCLASSLTMYRSAVLSCRSLSYRSPYTAESVTLVSSLLRILPIHVSVLYSCMSVSTTSTTESRNQSVVYISNRDNCCCAMPGHQRICDGRNVSMPWTNSLRQRLLLWWITNEFEIPQPSVHLYKHSS